MAKSSGGMRSGGAGRGPEFQLVRPRTDRAQHQHCIDHGQAGVEHDEADQAGDHLGGIGRRHAEERRQHAVDGPGLAAVFGHDP
ncbi:hypothetical protein CATMIT_01943, partial [Catenibacterium mitsuokai DSM 15897]